MLQVQNTRVHAYRRKMFLLLLSNPFVCQIRFTCMIVQLVTTGVH